MRLVKKCQSGLPCDNAPVAMWLNIICWLLVFAAAPVTAQDRMERTATPEREGGIPRELVVPEGATSNDNNFEQQGTEEGIPNLRVEENDRRLAPYWLPNGRERWKLGVNAYYSDSGAVVTQILTGSPAQQVGLERGDRIVAVSGYQVGWVHDRLYPLDAELQRQAGRSGQVLLLVQNVRTKELINLDVRLVGNPRLLRGTDRSPNRDGISDRSNGRDNPK